jgi:hypothetical protein
MSSNSPPKFSLSKMIHSLPAIDFFLFLRYPVRVRTEYRRIWERGGKSNKRVYRRRLNDKKEQKPVNKEMRKSLIEHGPIYTIL